jgi:hypothetical protein
LQFRLGFDVLKRYHDLLSFASQTGMKEEEKWLERRIDSISRVPTDEDEIKPDRTHEIPDGKEVMEQMLKKPRNDSMAEKSNPRAKSNRTKKERRL